MLNNYSAGFCDRMVTCVNAKNSVSFDDIWSIFEYTPYYRSNKDRETLSTFLTSIYSDDQPTDEAFLATPTPAMNSRTTGRYTITASN